MKFTTIIVHSSKQFQHMFQTIVNQNQENAQDFQKQLKPAVKAILKLVEKEEQELMEKIGKYHDQKIIKPVTDFQQEKSVLMKLLDIPAKERGKKELKNIKSEMSYLRCFQTHLYDQDIPKEVLAIMKRDLDMLTAIISKYVHARTYKKSTVLEVAGTDRKKIRILLKGDIAVFEPINYKSYKNCVKLLQTRKYQNLLMKTVQSFLDVNVNEEEEEEEYNNIIKTLNPEEMEENEWQDMHNQEKVMHVQTAKKLLQKLSLIGPTTPHRLSRHLKGEGLLVCSDQHHYIVNQQLIHEHTAICMGDCYVLELEYEVYRQAIAHLNSDEEKKFIQILLKRFDKMDYFDAKQYVKKEYMIDKRQEEKDRKQKLKLEPRNFTQFEKNVSEIEGRPLVVYESDEQEDDAEAKKKKKNMPDMQTFQIRYDNDLYMIAEGQVTLVVDVIEETRLSTLEQARKIRKKYPRGILKLYEGDLFGFQDIGKTKQYNLRYVVNKASKILLMSQDVYIKHYYEIEGFKDSVKRIQKERNILVRDIIDNLQKTVEEEQFRKYKSVAVLEKISMKQTKTKIETSIKHLVPSDLASPRQIQYMGHKKFQAEEEKLKLNIVKEKQGMDKIINLKHFANDHINLKDGLSFASLYKNTLPSNCKVVGDFVEVRDSKGSLLRRRSISNADNYPNPDPTRIFRRIGVVNHDERNEHNNNLIHNRRSKYELEDFQKQKKEFDRLKEIAVSLPKLDHLYAKKEDLLYKNLNKLNYKKF